MNYNPYFVFAVQMIAVPIFIFWGMGCLAVGHIIHGKEWKSGKPILKQKNPHKSLVNQIQVFPDFYLFRIIGVILAYIPFIAAYVTLPMIIIYIVQAYIYSF